MTERSALSLLLHQYRYDRKTFWRDPASVFFTVTLPLIFLFLFTSIFGNGTILVGGDQVKGSTYYVPGILSLSIVSATTVNLAISMSILREKGVLKRIRSTPLPPWAFMGGRVLTAASVSLVMVVLVSLIGWIVYGVEVPTSTIPGLVATLLIATTSLSFLGFAITAAIPSEDAAPAVTNAVVLPLYFLSGVFIPSSELPSGLRAVGELFPVKHLFEALFTAFDPATTGAGFEPLNLAVIAAWGAAGALVAVRAFRWTPRAGAR